MRCLVQSESGMEGIGEGGFPSTSWNYHILRCGGGRLAGRTAEVVLFRLAGFPHTSDAAWVRCGAGFYGWPC